MIELEEILSIVESVVGKKYERTRKLDDVTINQVYCYLARKHTAFSLQKIGSLIGIGYGAVMHGINLVSNDLEYNNYKQIVDKCLTHVKTTKNNRTNTSFTLEETLLNLKDVILNGDKELELIVNNSLGIEIIVKRNGKRNKKGVK